jgi:hypothetical protein
VTLITHRCPKGHEWKSMLVNAKNCPTCRKEAQGQEPTDSNVTDDEAIKGLAWRIYEALKAKGCGIGNASVPFIERELKGCADLLAASREALDYLNEFTPDAYPPGLVTASSALHVALEAFTQGQGDDRPSHTTSVG